MNLDFFPTCSYDWWFRAGLDYTVCLSTAIFAAFAFGACLGSFLNVCIWRIPRGESVVTAPSHCVTCNHEIRWFDNLPIISFIVLRGRCRYCRTPYSCRYFIVELITALLFVAVFLKVGLSRQVPAVLPLYWWLILLSISSAWIDAKHRIIPDALTYPAIAFGIVTHALLPSAAGLDSHVAGLIYALISAALAGAFPGIFAWLGQMITKKDVLGWGDVKFICACGALTGVPGALFILLAGSLSGSIYGAVMALRRGKKLSRCTIPFGPFLAAGAIVWALCGNWIWQWYTNLLRY